MKDLPGGDSLPKVNKKGGENNWNLNDELNTKYLRETNIGTGKALICQYKDNTLKYLRPPSSTEKMDKTDFPSVSEFYSDLEENSEKWRKNTCQIIANETGASGYLRDMNALKPGDYMTGNCASSPFPSCSPPPVPLGLNKRPGPIAKITWGGDPKSSKLIKPGTNEISQKCNAEAKRMANNTVPKCKDTFWQKVGSIATNLALVAVPGVSLAMAAGAYIGGGITGGDWNPIDGGAGGSLLNMTKEEACRESKELTTTDYETPPDNACPPEFLLPIKKEYEEYKPIKEGNRDDNQYMMDQWKNYCPNKCQTVWQSLGCDCTTKYTGVPSSAAPQPIKDIYDANKHYLREECPGFTIRTFPRDVVSREKSEPAYRYDYNHKFWKCTQRSRFEKYHLAKGAAKGAKCAVGRRSDVITPNEQNYPPQNRVKNPLEFDIKVGGKLCQDISNTFGSYSNYKTNSDGSETRIASNMVFADTKMATILKGDLLLNYSQNAPEIIFDKLKCRTSPSPSNKKILCAKMRRNKKNITDIHTPIRQAYEYFQCGSETERGKLPPMNVYVKTDKGRYIRDSCDGEIKSQPLDKIGNLYKMGNQTGNTHPDMIQLLACNNQHGCDAPATKPLEVVWNQMGCDEAHINIELAKQEAIRKDEKEEEYQVHFDKSPKETFKELEKRSNEGVFRINDIYTNTAKYFKQDINGGYTTEIKYTRTPSDYALDNNYKKTTVWGPTACLNSDDFVNSPDDPDNIIKLENGESIVKTGGCSFDQTGTITSTPKREYLKKYPLPLKKYVIKGRTFDNSAANYDWKNIRKKHSSVNIGDQQIITQKK